MRIAYADPPYIGQARKHYGQDPRCAEVDHKLLIQQLEEYDGWALSCSSPSLKEILSYCPSKVRIGAWVKPFCSFKPNVNPAYAWEPVVFVPARGYHRKDLTVRDWMSHNITLKRGLCGVKPYDFSVWMFRILGADGKDDFHDLYPGSGAVTKAWASWKNSFNFNHMRLET